MAERPQSGGEDTMQVYSQSGKSITIKRNALSAAQKQGWSPNAPSKVDGGQGQGQGQGMQPIGFMKGFGGGLNPFHSVPEGMQPDKLTGVERFGYDMVNGREIGNRLSQGNYSGATGMAMGTLIGFLGPEEVKGASKALRATGIGERAAKGIPAIAKIAKRAKQTAQEFGGGVEAARFAERYVAPLREALDKKFEGVHKALADKAFMVSEEVIQQINLLQKSEIPAVKKLGADLARIAKNGAITYEEAQKLVEGTAPSTIAQLKKLRADHWIPEIEKLADETGKGIDDLARSYGLDAARDAYKGMYKEVKDLTRAVVVTATEKPSLAKRAGAIVGGGVLGAAIGHPLAGAYGAAHVVNGKSLRLTDEAVLQGVNLAHRLGVDYREMVGHLPNAKEIAGDVFTKLIRAYQGGQAAGAVRRGGQ